MSMEEELVPQSNQGGPRHDGRRWDGELGGVARADPAADGPRTGGRLSGMVLDTEFIFEFIKLREEKISPISQGSWSTYAEFAENFHNFPRS